MLLLSVHNCCAKPAVCKPFFLFYQNVFRAYVAVGYEPCQKTLNTTYCHSSKYLFIVEQTKEAAKPWRGVKESTQLNQGFAEHAHNKEQHNGHVYGGNSIYFQSGNVIFKNIIIREEQHGRTVYELEVFAQYFMYVILFINKNSHIESWFRDVSTWCCFSYQSHSFLLSLYITNLIWIMLWHGARYGISNALCNSCNGHWHPHVSCFTLKMF